MKASSLPRTSRTTRSSACEPLGLSIIAADSIPVDESSKAARGTLPPAVHLTKLDKALQEVRFQNASPVSESLQRVQNPQAKAAWAALVDTYICDHDPYEFPIWVLGELGKKTVLACLGHEFGVDVLDDLYSRGIGHKTCQRLAALAGSDSPHLLALWFGADKIRTPTTQTLGLLLRSGILGGREDPQASDSKEFCQALRSAHKNWAARQGYGLTCNSERKLCIFACLPDASLERRDRVRLSLKDFGITRYLGHHPAPSPVSLADQAGASPAPEPAQSGDHPRAFHRTRSSRSKSMSATVFSSDLASDKLDNQPSRFATSPPFRRDTMDGTDLQPGPHPQLLLTTKQTITVSTPKVQTTDTRSPVSASTESEPPSALHSTDPGTAPDGSTPLTDMEDTAISAVLGVKRCASSSPASPIPKRASRWPRSTSQGRLPESAVEPMVRVEPIRERDEPIDVETQAVDLRSSIILTLQRGGGREAWLDGAAVDHFVQMVAFLRPSFTTVTSLVLQDVRDKNRPENLTLSQRFIDPSTNNHIDNILIGLSLGMSHWVLVMLNCSGPYIRIYDSLARGNTRRSVEFSLSRLMPFLPDRLVRADIEYARCPQQCDGDTHNCGVFVVVNSFYLASGVSLPTRVDISQWRKLLLSMCTQSSLASLFPDSVVRIDGSIERVDDASTQFPITETAMTTLDVIDLLAKRAVQLSKRHLKRCKSLEETATKALAWVENEVAPVILRLQDAATAEVQRLGELLERLRLEITGLRECMTRMDEVQFTLLPIVDTVRLVRENLDRLERLKKVQKLRLQTAQEAMDAFKALDVARVVSDMRRTRDRYREEVMRAQDVVGRWA